MCIIHIVYRQQERCRPTTDTSSRACCTGRGRYRIYHVMNFCFNFNNCSLYKFFHSRARLTSRDPARRGRGEYERTYVDGCDELLSEGVDGGDAVVELERGHVLTEVLGQLMSQLFHFHLVHLQLTQLTLSSLRIDTQTHTQTRTLSSTVRVAWRLTSAVSTD